MKIEFRPSGGIAPKVSARLLAETQAVTALNCKLTSGELRAWREPLTVGAVAGEATTQGMYLFDRATSNWFAWPADVDVAKAPLAADSLKRTYYTGDGIPKVTDSDLAVNNGIQKPAASFPLGIPAPTTAIIEISAGYDLYSAAATYAIGDYVQLADPAAFDVAKTYYYGEYCTYGVSIYLCIAAEALGVWNINQWSLRDEAELSFVCVVAVTVAEEFDWSKWEQLQSVDKEARAYVVTNVSAAGEESAPSPVSEIINVWAGQEVTLTIPVPVGGYNIASQRLYRTSTGTSATEFQFLDEIGADVTTYVDVIPAANLGEVLLSTDWLPPPANLQGLIALPNGCMAGFFDKSLCLSVPFQPHAWPLAYRKLSVNPIVSIAAFGTSILVTTTGFPAIATGSDPATLELEKLETGFACVSKRGTVDMGTVIIYPSAVGLVAIGTGVLELLTRDLYAKAEWKALNPSSIHGYHFAGMYIGFYDTGTVQGGFVFNLEDKSMTSLDLYATAGFYDEDQGELYLCINEQVVQWEPVSGALRPYLWESKEFTTQPVNMAGAKVIASSYPLTFTLYAGGVLKLTKTVSSDRTFRCPAGFRGERWRFGLAGTVDVAYVAVAETLEEL